MIRFTIPNKVNEEEIELTSVSSHSVINYFKTKSIDKISDVFSILDSLPRKYNLGIYKIDNFENCCLMTRREKIKKPLSITSKFYRKLINELYSIPSIEITHDSNVFIIKEIANIPLLPDYFIRVSNDYFSNNLKTQSLVNKINDCLIMNINNNKPLKGDYYFVFMDELIWYLSEKIKNSFAEKKCLLSNKDILLNKNQDEFNNFIMHLYVDRDAGLFLRNWMLLYKDLNDKELIEAFLNRIKVPFKGFCFEKDDNLMDLKIKVQ